jgi:hypothetical protein
MRYVHDIVSINWQTSSSPLRYALPTCTSFNRGASLDAYGRRASCFRNLKRFLRVRYCMSRVTGLGGRGGSCSCHVCQGERGMRDMSLWQRLLKKIWRRVYASFAPSVFLKGWELSNVKEDCHPLGDERQVECAFLFRNVLFILWLVQEFLLLCEGKIFV